MDIRFINKDTPTVAEIKKWMEQTSTPLDKFYNKNGKRYKELNLKKNWQDMSENELVELLTSDFKLFKRPVLIGGDFLLSGFKILEWENTTLLQKIKG